MNTQSNKDNRATQSKRPLIGSILKWTGIGVGSIIGLVLVTLCGLSLYLSPDRLTTIANREASQYLIADIHAHNISYTLWSSFPRFRITTDSITVRSRSLDSIPSAIRDSLPSDADFLGSLSSFKGSINVIDLFLHRYVIHDVEIDGLRVNLVAYNDSINNYSIIPTTGEPMKDIPYFSADVVRLSHPGALTYYSHASDTKASLQLSDLLLHRKEESREGNSYRLDLGGAVTARSAGISVLHDFPFRLSGDVALRFNPFGVAMTDYGIDLGEIHSKLSMSVGMGDDPRIESFDYRISSVNLMNLLGYIPKEYMPSLQGLQADLPISASARLLSSWSLSSEVFPSIEVDFAAPQGEISYTVSNSNHKGMGSLQTYTLAHSAIKGIFLFDGKDPAKSYLDIPSFTISTSGLEADVRGKITDLENEPLVEGNLGITADIARAMQMLPPVGGMTLSGNLASDTRFSFRLSSFSSEALAQGLMDLRTAGDVEIHDLHIGYPDEGISVYADKFKVNLDEQASALTPEALSNPLSNLSFGLNTARATTPFGDFKLSGLNISTRAAASGEVTPRRLQEGLPLKFDLQAGSLEYRDSTGSFRVNAKGIDLRDFVAKTSPNTFKQALSDGLSIKAREATVKSGDGTYSISRPALRLEINERNPGVLDSLPNIFAADPVVSQPATVTPKSAGPAHTPELISFSAPPQLKKFFTSFRFATDFSASRVELDAPGFGDKDYLADIDLSLNEENLNLRSLTLDLSGTPAHMNGKISNLRKFLTEPASVSNPIILDFNADVPRININALSRSYVESKGGEAAVRARPTSSPSDTVAMLIPRNIQADIHAKVGETNYTNLNLTDLVADISVADGVADVKRLGLVSSFGSAEAAFKYDTSDLYHMSAGADLHINNIDIVKFFAKFHSLLEMMPQMKNLSGYISIDGTLNSDIFPTMYLNIPSARADVNVQGRELLVHQNKFIRRITKMMLIRTAGDIHIKDIDVRAAMHDNLLQLYPFNFEFDRYKLHMLGVNNFNGRLYYHIAVEESPVPFPFSINIEGMFHDPKLRFGGPSYDIRRGEEVTSRIQEVNNVNLMHVLRSFLTEFICTGARYNGNDD